MVLAVARKPELVTPLRRIFAGDREPVAAVSRAVIDSGACDEARARAVAHTREAIDGLAGIKASPARLLLEGVAQQLAARVG